MPPLKKFKPKPPAVGKTKRACVLLTTTVETRVLVHYASLRDVLNVPAKPDDPVTVTVTEAMRLTGLSRPTVDRMIRRGRAVAAAA